MNSSATLPLYSFLSSAPRKSAQRIRVYLALLVVCLSLGYFSTRLSRSFAGCWRGGACLGRSSADSFSTHLSVQDQARQLFLEEILNPALQATPETSLSTSPDNDVVTTEKAVAVAVSKSIIQTYSPITSGSKVAFLFLTRGHMPMERLWMRFFQGHEGMYSIYVHASDPAYQFRREELASELFVGRGLPSKPVGWGQLSIVDAERRLLAWALLDLKNTFFVILSEKCIPIRSFEYVFRYYLNSGGRSFVDMFNDQDGHGAGRYRDSLLPEMPMAAIRKGSAWFALERRHALALVADKLYYSRFFKHCTVVDPYCFPDEHYIPTFLNLMDPGGFYNYSTTYTLWKPGQFHPETFQLQQISSQLIQEMQGDTSMFHQNQAMNLPLVPCVWNGVQRPCFLFARKFDPSTIDALLNLPKEVLGY